MCTDRIFAVIEAEINRLQQARAIFAQIDAGGRGPKAIQSARPKRKLSAAARERIAATQRKRRAAVKKRAK